MSAVIAGFLALTLASAAEPAAPATTPSPDAASEAELRELHDLLVASFNTKDVDGLVDAAADGIVVLDPVRWRPLVGKEPLKEVLLELFHRTDARLKLRSTAFAAHGDVAHGSGVFELHGRDARDGADLRLLGRFSTILERRGGRWACVALHASVPLPPRPAAPTR